MEEKMKSRKFILALLYTAVIIVMRIFNKLDAENFSHLLIAFFAIYCGANVTSKFVQK